MCKNDKQVWCFGCGRKLDEVQLAFSQDIEEYQEMEEEHDSDDDTMDMVRLHVGGNESNISNTHVEFGQL